MESTVWFLKWDTIGLEVVSKPPLRHNLFVGTRCSILKILNIFLRLKTLLRRDLEPD
jgi:hypothetical protein